MVQARRQCDRNKKSYPVLRDSKQLLKQENVGASWAHGGHVSHQKG